MKQMMRFNQIYLRKVYPKVYSRTKNFLCGDGWFEILDHLGLLINQYFKEENKSEKYFCLKVKEKFGILFIDYEGVDNLIHVFIKSAERLSYHTCEICGNAGKLHSSELKSPFEKLETLCKKCALKKIYWEV